METLIEKIISGGQTGVDRAALDVAMELGIPCGAGARRAGGRRTDGFRSIIPCRRPLRKNIRCGPG